ncbi:MAG: hypothetical protein WBN44_13355 [Woeseiaceae bacterium]
MEAVIHKDKAAIPGLLRNMGLLKESGEPLSRDMTDPYVELVHDVVRTSPPFTFGDDASLYESLYELGMENWQDANDIRVPRDMLFIDRTLIGLFGNLGKLRATGPWRALVRSYTAPSPAGQNNTERRQKNAA